jgi:lysozyme
MTNVIGPDFSHWDGLIDFTALESSDAGFAFFKCGQGVRVDSQFNRSAAECASIGLPGGAYWYYDAYIPPLSQAVTLAGAVAGKTLPLGIAIDYEDPHVGQYGGWRHLAVFMQKTLDLLPGVRLFIYTGYYYWMEHRPHPVYNLASYLWFKKFPLWIAQYNGQTAPNRIPGPWSDWLFWQYTEDGDPEPYGSQKMAVDLNQFHGDQAAFDAWLVEAPPPVTPPAPTVYRGTVKATAGVNVRTEPSATATKIGAIPYGASVTGDELRVVGADKWLHLTAPLVGWAAQYYAGATLIQLL